MLKCSVKDVIVSQDLLDLSRKSEEDLYPFCVITSLFQLGFEFLIAHISELVNVVSSNYRIGD